MARSTLTYESVMEQRPGVYERWEGTVSRTTKIRVNCPVHGWFEQQVRSVLEGRTCIQCGAAVGSDASKIDTAEFIKRAVARHGTRYNYDSTNYLGARKRVSITCSLHGEFMQEARVHLQGHGCPSCSLAR